MLLNSKNMKPAAILCVSMALTLFAIDLLLAEVDFLFLNMLPYLFSAFAGLALVSVYLSVFPSLVNRNFFWSLLLPGTVPLALIIFSGIDKFWIVEGQPFLLAFVLCGQNLGKNQKQKD